VSAQPHVYLDGQCPYCEYTWTLELRTVRGKLFALRCFDCGEAFVVDAVVSVESTVMPVAGVDRDAVLDELIAREIGRSGRIGGDTDTPETPPGAGSGAESDDLAQSRMQAPIPEIAPSRPLTGPENRANWEPPGPEAETAAEKAPEPEPHAEHCACDDCYDKPVERPEPDDKRRKLSYDDRTRIRVRYQAELDDARARGLQKISYGFVAALAAEFGVTKRTITNIGRNADSFD
jgi:hypothetical protein